METALPAVRRRATWYQHSRFGPERIWSLSRAAQSKGCKRASRLLKLVNFFLYRAALPPEVVVGEKVKLGHYAMGVVIHPNVTLGNNVLIWHNTTLAVRSAVGTPWRIIVEDDVEIGANVVVMAPPGKNLVIGKGSTIGAGSVITKDVPAGAVVVGENRIID